MATIPENILPWPQYCRQKAHAKQGHVADNMPKKENGGFEPF